MVITISCLGNKEPQCNKWSQNTRSKQQVSQQARSPTFGRVTKVSHCAACGKGARVPALKGALAVSCRFHLEPLELSVSRDTNNAFLRSVCGGG